MPMSVRSASTKMLAFFTAGAFSVGWTGGWEVSAFAHGVHQTNGGLQSSTWR